MQALWISTIAVAIAEIGDKTQLLSLVLAARYRRPWPIIAAIALATVLNHALAAWIGAWVAGWFTPGVLRWAVAASFLAVALWALKPDTLDDERAPEAGRWGVFGVTVVAFFLAEMGDKTQIATVMLAAKFDALAAVVVGTTLGMLIANVPVVFAGKLAADRIPFKAIRIVAAAIFAAIGAWVLVAGVPG